MAFVQTFFFVLIYCFDCLAFVLATPNRNTLSIKLPTIVTLPTYKCTMIIFSEKIALSPGTVPLKVKPHGAWNRGEMGEHIKIARIVVLVVLNEVQ